MKKSKPSYFYWRVYFTIGIPIFVTLYFLEKNNQINLAILLIVMFLIWVVFSKISNITKKLGFKRWSEENNLVYIKKNKVNFFSVRSANIRDIIRGDFMGKRIFVYNAINFETNFETAGYINRNKKPKMLSRHMTVINGQLYDQLSIFDVKNILLGKKILEPYDLKSFTDNNFMSFDENMMLVISGLYLKTGFFIDYDEARKIYELVRRYKMNNKSNSDIQFLSKSIKSTIEKEIDETVLKDFLMLCDEYIGKYNIS